jgi:hypothetical protein
MTNKLDQVIDISISLSTKAITQQGFGTPMILGTSMKLDTRLKEYLDISAVAIDFVESDVEYKMAEAEFSQEKTPDSVMIGKKVVLASTALTAATNPSGNIVNLNLTDIGKKAEVGCTAVVSGFSTSGYNGTFIITDIIDDNNIRYTAAGVLAATPAVGSGSIVLSETWSNALQKVFDYNQNWYCAHLSSNVEADILSAAAKIESLKRFLIVRSSDTDVLDSVDTGSVLYQLKALNYDRTALIWNGDTSTKYIDAAWGGRMLPTIPGSENWAWKTLKGVVADEINVDGVRTNNGNTYEIFAGRSCTGLGKVVSGEYIDIIRGVDWLKARLQENIFLLLINSEKVPMEDAGGDLVENAMREIFEQGVQNGLIRKDSDGKGIYTITVPNVASIPTADRLARYLSGITFTGELAGAINKIGIAGNLSV